MSWTAAPLLLSLLLPPPPPPPLLLLLLVLLLPEITCSWSHPASEDAGTGTSSVSGDALSTSVRSISHSRCCTAYLEQPCMHACTRVPRVHSV